MKKRLLSIILAVVMVFSVFGFAFAAGAATGYTDVKEGMWYTEYVEDVTALGYFIGYPDGTFQPEGSITRAEIVLVLARMAQRMGLARNYDLNAAISESPFEDVPVNMWYSAAIKWAADEEITLGMGDNKFVPQAPIAREDACTLIYRFMKYVGENKGTYYTKNYDASLIFEFVDEAQIRAYAAEAVDTCMAYGIIEGFPDGTFQPRGNWTRAQGAKMISVLHDVLDVPTTPIVPNPPVVDDRILEEILEDGDSKTLTADYTITAENGYLLVGIYEWADVTLDLNGHTLTLDDDFYGINTFGKFTIKNGTIIVNVTGQIHAAAGGSLTLENVKVIQKAGNSSGLTNHGGTVVIDGCEFINENPTNNAVISNGIVNSGVEYAGTMTISNTTISGTFEDPGMPVIWNWCGTLTFGENVVVNAEIPEHWAYKHGPIDVDEAHAVCYGSVTVNGVVVNY